MRQLFSRQHTAKFLTILILLLPTLWSVFAPQNNTTENRNLVPFPALPHSWQDSLKYSAQIDLWINDHTGFRNQLIDLNNRLHYALFRQFPTIQVIQGQRGRIFLAAHNTRGVPYSAILDPCGVGFTELDKLVSQLNYFETTLQNHHLHANLMIAPSAPVAQADDLPRWLARLCKAHTPPIQQALQAPGLSKAAQQRIYYPLAAMRTAPMPIFPEVWFHWGGNGTRLISELSAQQLWQINPGQATALASRPVSVPSDISHLFPGVKLENRVEMIDFSASGVVPCEGPACFPELPGIKDKLSGLSRYRNPKAEHEKLILITDSFGHALAPWYARYYQDVLQIDTNELVHLNREEAARLSQFLFQRNKNPKPAPILFVYHDNTIQAGRIKADFKQLFPQAPTFP